MKSMKRMKHILMGALAVVVAGACNQGIDPISHVEPGPDELDPSVTISYPGDGSQVRSTQDVMPLDIQFEVSDDIEIKTITVSLDGTQIASFDDFIDYRRAVKSYTYQDLTNGEHSLTITATDLSGKNTSESVEFEKVPPYVLKYDGEIFYMPFDGDYIEQVSIKNATRVGTPAFTTENVAGGKSYAGATGAYLTFPTAGLLSNSFSAAFWYKLNATPDRSGILTIGPPDTANPSLPNNRTTGFRFFREAGNGGQTFKLNVGNGAADSWFDGGATAMIPASTTDWVHLAFTISPTQCVVYINGEVVKQDAFTGISWTGCDVLSIESGAPRFMEWGHLSDISYMDELRLFNKALTKAEVQAVMNGD